MSVVPESDGGRIRELDGWRAIAASMVLISHFLGHQHIGTITRVSFLCFADESP